MIRLTACLFVFIALGSSVYAGWYSEVETDQMTDKETLLIISDNDNAAIVCRPDQTALILFIIPDGKRISKDIYKVQYRFDKETVDTLFFNSAGGSSIFLICQV